MSKKIIIAIDKMGGVLADKDTFIEKGMEKESARRQVCEFLLHIADINKVLNNRSIHKVPEYDKLCALKAERNSTFEKIWKIYTEYHNIIIQEPKTIGNMTAEELAEVLKTVNANRPQVTQTMNFNAPIGQQIAHVDKIEAHFDKDMGMQIANVEEMSKTTEKPILPTEDTTSNCGVISYEQCICFAESNVIFNSRILTTEVHYRKVRDVILRFIKKDGVTSDVEQINPSAQNEWYYIMKGIRESGMASSSMGDTKFAGQMVTWYPDLFAEKIGEGESKDFVRNFAKSISAERNNYWTKGTENKEVAIIDMHAHARTRNIDSGKAKRAFGIANGLKKALEELKKD